MVQRPLPRTPTRNVGGFRNSPHTPLKRPDQGGLRAPLFWTSSPGNTNSAVPLCARVAAAGQEGQIVFDYPKSAHKPPDAAAQYFKESCPAHPAQTEGSQHTDSLNSRNKQRGIQRMPNLRHKSDFFSTGRGGFSLARQRKAGAHSCGKAADFRTGFRCKRIHTPHRNGAYPSAGAARKESFL